VAPAVGVTCTVWRKIGPGRCRSGCKLICNGKDIADLAQCMFCIEICLFWSLKSHFGGRRLRNSEQVEMAVRECLISTVTEILNFFQEEANASVFSGIMVKMTILQWNRWFSDFSFNLYVLEHLTFLAPSYIRRCERFGETYCLHPQGKRCVEQSLHCHISSTLYRQFLTMNIYRCPLSS
jgi:hypothetical protein